MHTLPQPILEVCALNGRTNVVAFYSSRGQIALYRLNGEIVWTSPARKQKQPKKMVWSPKGDHLAVIYEDGMLQIFSEHTGRTTQIIANENASSICWQTDPPRHVDEVPHEFEWNENLIHCIGSRKSQLKITLDGVLPIGALDFDSSPIEQILVENRRIYSVLSRNAIYCIHAEYLNKYSPRQIDDLVVKAARVQKLGDGLKNASTKFQADQVTFSKNLAQFLPVNDPISSIYSTLISRHPDEDCAQWIEDMHETGFKKWVKATDTYYNNLQNLLATKLVASVQHLVIYLSDIYIEGKHPLDDIAASISQTLDECRGLACSIYTQLVQLGQKLTNEKHMYTCFACILQVIYCQHLDRTINVIDKKTAQEADWIDAIEYVQLTLADPLSLQVPMTEIKALESKVSSLMDIIKQELRQQLQRQASHQWPDLELVEMSQLASVYHIIAKKADQYKLIEWSSANDEFTIRELGNPNQVFFEDSRLIVLEPHQLCVYAASQLELLETHKLNYEGISCSVSGNTAVVVSKDCLHFETLKL